MKRKISISAAYILMVILVSVCITGCFDSRIASVDFISNGSHIFIDSECSSVSSFYLALFSKQKIQNIEYIGFEGVNMDNNNYEVIITDSGLDILDSYKYKGYYLKYIMVDITPKNEETNDCNFKKIVLNVDGIIRKIPFATPVEHKFSGGNVFTEPLQISVLPNEMPSSFINDINQGPVYEFFATEDILLQEIRFTDFFYPANIIYSIDNNESNKADFPISVKKDQRLKISFSFMSESVDKFSYVSTNIHFDYVTKSGTPLYNSAVIVFDPISPISDNDLSPIKTLFDSIAK